MKSIYTFLLFALFSNAIQAQNLDWAKAFGGTANDESQGITIDNAGNVLTTGRFMGTVDFDPGANTENLVSNGYNDVFIQKLDNAGNYVWAKSLGGTLRDDGYAITTDNSGNVYVTGRFEGVVDFNPGAQVFNLTSNGNRDIFVLKLDASGNFIWAISMGEVQNDRGYSITTDVSGSVYVTGYFAGTVDFNPAAATANLTSVGNDDVFILKLDASGNYVWAKSFGGTANDEGWVVTTDNSGNVLITGFFEGTVDFNPNAAVFNLTSNGSIDAFILKLDANGGFVWATSLGGITLDSGHSIATDAAGNVYTAGYFEGMVDFDPSAAAFNLTANGQSDAFIQKLSSSGSYVWAKAMGGSGLDQAYGVVLDALGSVFITGYFEGTVDFDPSAATFNVTSNGEIDVFVQKLDANGNFVWASATGSTGSDLGYAITTDALGITYLTGYFEGTVDFDPGAATVNLTSNGQTDIFIQKLNLTSIGLEDLAATPAPFVFPNPANDVLNIDFGNLKNVTIRIFDVAGCEIYAGENSFGGSQQITLNVKPGVYFVELSTQSVRLNFKVLKL